MQNDVEDNRGLVELPCVLCGSEDREHLLSTEDRLVYGGGELYDIVRCEECGFLYLNPRPSNESLGILPFIEGGDAFNTLTDPKSISDFIFKLLHPASVKWKRRRLDRLQLIGRLLDFGCRTGDFLFEMKRAKWEVAGIESDDLCRDFARSHYNLDIVPYLKDILQRDDEKFDVVTMWHTLDRVPNLGEVLDGIKSILTDDGYLLIALPNTDSYDFKIYKDNWIGLDAPRHLYFFNPSSLTRAARDHQFRVERQKQIHWDVLHNVFMSELFKAKRKHRSSKWVINWPLVLWTLTVSWFCGTNLQGVGGKCGGSGVLYYLRHGENS